MRANFKVRWFMVAGGLALCLALPVVYLRLSRTAPQAGIPVFDGMVIDLKDINVLAGTQEHVFRFRNVGSTPLQISHVRSDCSCALASNSVNPIGSGDWGEVRLRFDPASRKGDFEHKAYVMFAGNETACSVLTLRGHVAEPLEVEPRSLYFGRVDVHDAGELTFSVRNRTNTTVQVLGAKSNGAVLTLAADRDTLLPGETARVKAAIATGTTPGRISGFVELTTDLKVASSLRVPFSGWVDDGPISPSERNIALGFVRAQERVERSVLLRHKQGKPFRIAHVTVSSPLFEAVASEGWSTSHQITLSTSARWPSCAAGTAIEAQASAAIDLGTEQGACVVEVTAFAEGDCMTRGDATAANDSAAEAQTKDGLGPLASQGRVGSLATGSVNQALDHGRSGAWPLLLIANK